MLSLEEISDRLEIQQLLVDYSTAIDRRRFDDLDDGLHAGRLHRLPRHRRHRRPVPEVKEWLAEVLPNFPAYSHMLGNFDVQHRRRHRDRADDLLQPDGAQRASRSRSCSVGLWYDDEFVRTADGWRMTRRVETKCFDKIV